MLDLSVLSKLPGAADQNFEVLTRALVSRRFGAAGVLRERRNQPGVEFYLRILRSCPLGDSGRVFGWSCKWFLLGADNELTKGQRGQIEDSIDKAIKYVDGLTDFVLCLPQRPAKKDLQWYYDLAGPKGVELDLWAEENFDAELVGCDELRAAFFGELVVTPEGLARAHGRSVAPIRARWVPPLHTGTLTDEELELALLRPSTFEPLEVHANAIASRVARLRESLDAIDDVTGRADAASVAEDLDAFSGQLLAIVDAARGGRPMEIRERLADRKVPATSPRRLRALVLALRKRRLPAALAVSGLGAEVRSAVSWLQHASDLISTPLIAVVAAAGHGKTQLGAQLTAPEDANIAGVFIQGGRLRAGETLDELARRIPGLKVDRFEDLLEALDAAGARSGQRLPLVVDGLNEAERPTGWRPLLEQLVPVLDAYPHVLVVLTLREKLAEQAIPDEAIRLDLDWDRASVEELLDNYFTHYLIEPSGAWLPWGMFHNPLFVRMYCEAANSERTEPVGAEALPTSLVGVFELYREGVAQRLADDPARKPVPADEIKRRLARLASELWNQGVRRIPSDDARAMLDEAETDWDESPFRRLEEEGVILRDELNSEYDTVSGVVFDRFAGYLVADALLAHMRYGEIEGQLADPALWSFLVGEEAHPLGEDVAVCLVGLVPRRFGGHHLWMSAPEGHATWALAQELNNESELLEERTVDALAELVSGWSSPTSSFPYGRRHPFDRLWEVSSAPSHRLNAVFLDRVLRSLQLPERDRRWTEWVRTRASDQLIAELKSQTDYWGTELDRGEGDDLYALAVGWLLSSTDKDVRDLATKALQRFGRPDPKRLFDLAATMIDVDDPYIEERVVAASLGAASAHQMPDPGGPFERALGRWLAVLKNRYLDGGTGPTSHELLRTYVRSTFEFAGALHWDAVPPGIKADDLTFAVPPPAGVMAEDDPNAAECSRTFGMDFENYVLGSTIEGRSNYDFDHPEFRRARGEVMARVWSLGWRADLLGGVDRAIAEARDRLSGSRANVERYGKKYGWIAYYEHVGRLADAGQCAERWVGGGRNVSPDIDPTFPDEPPVGLVDLPEWAPAAPTDDEDWLRSGQISVPDILWSPPELGGVGGAWLLVEGFLEHRRGGRRVFGFFRTLLIEHADVDAAVALIEGRPYPGNHFLPELAKVHGVFAGEMPWSPRFNVVFDDDEGPHRPTLQQDWKDPGIPVDQLAVELGTGDIDSPTGLQRSYSVPSFAFADHFGLRQFPGSLDLVGLEGARASMVCRAEGQWRGHLLFIRRDLVVDHAGARRVVRVAWGERAVTVDWGMVPAWVREVNETHGNVWRIIDVLDDRRTA
jgi:hypothetical protein